MRLAALAAPSVSTGAVIDRPADLGGDRVGDFVGTPSAPGWRSSTLR
jgi:hypothetical protein